MYPTSHYQKPALVKSIIDIFFGKKEGACKEGGSPQRKSQFGNVQIPFEALLGKARREKTSEKGSL